MSGKNRLTTLTSCLLLLIVFYLPGLPAQTSPAHLDQLVRAGKQEIYHFRLDKSLLIFREVQKQYPNYPQGFFYESYITAIYFSQDKTNDSLDTALHRTVERSVDVGEAFKKRDPTNPDALYYLGVSYGVLGIYHVLNRSYFKGYINGRRGKNYLEKVVRIDSSYYDAYLGLGIFHYYVDLLPGVVKFFASILGFHGDRRKGIREIGLTAQRGQFFAVEAKFVYSAIRYFFEGRKQVSLRTFIQLQNTYPENPALTLLIGYHYRRMGQLKQALHFFKSVSISYEKKLPQISVMRYYNTGVCYFRMNKLPEAEAVFDSLIQKPIRKTAYYQSALSYYKGLLADMRFKRAVAEKYYRKIPKSKDTRYWYHISRLNVEFEMDSLLRAYFIASNQVFMADFPAAGKTIRYIFETLDRGTVSPSVPYFKYLAEDLRAKYDFRRGRVKKSEERYRAFINQAEKVKDDFYRAWIYIQYARVLRERKKWREAEKMLNIAKSCDDEYTRLIIEREKYIIKSLKSA